MNYYNLGNELKENGAKPSLVLASFFYWPKVKRSGKISVRAQSNRDFVILYEIKNRYNKKKNFRDKVA